MQKVLLNLDFSHWCSVKDLFWNNPTLEPDNFEDTHDWEFRIKDSKDGDMSHYIELIVIKLPRSFDGFIPVKEFTLTKPPFVVKGSENGQFIIDVEIYFKGFSAKDPDWKTHVQYSLFLSPSLEVLRLGKRDNLKRENTFTQRKNITISHKDPSVIKRLVKGGGALQDKTSSSVFKFPPGRPHPAIPGPAMPSSANPGPANPGPTNPDPANPGPARKRPASPGPASPQPARNRPARSKSLRFENEMEIEESCPQDLINYAGEKDAQYLAQLPVEPVRGNTKYVLITCFHES